MKATYIGPHLKCGRVNFIQLIKVAIHNRIFRQSVLGAGGDNDGAWNFLTGCCFVVDLKEIRI